MSVNTEFGNDLKIKLVQGMEILNKSVSSTLGPSGRNVLIENPDGTIQVTKDGVTVAKSFDKLEDSTQNIGAQLLKQVSIKAADKAGDGTTTATLLATTIVREGIKVIQPGSNPVEVKKGLDKAVKAVVSSLKAISREISSQEQITQVATVSANNDPEIGKLIATALQKVGHDGLVTIEEIKDGGETNLESVEGMQFDRGYKSPYFVTDNESMSAILPKSRVLICADRIDTGKQMLPFLEYISKLGIPLLIVADDFGDDAVGTLLVNKTRAGLKVCAVRAPGYGDTKKEILQDIAVITGGTVLSRELGYNLDKLPKDIVIEDVLGEARMINVTRDQTTIIDGKGDIKAINSRLEEIKVQVDKSKSHYETEKLQERLAKMIGGVAIINVGGVSEVEIKERKDRVDDSLHATKAAIAEGIVPGGGMALINCLDAIVDSDYDNSDQLAGANIIRKALKAPFNKILENAGIDNPYEILQNIKSGEFDENSSLQDLLHEQEDPDYVAPEQEWKGYNVKTGEYENFLYSGVLDPTKVTRTALENAASVAGVILTTESVVYTKKEEKKVDEGFDMNQFNM